VELVGATYFLARGGYDWWERMCPLKPLSLAKTNPMFTQKGKVEFVVMDYEEMNFQNEFDAVVSTSHCITRLMNKKAIHRAYAAIER